MGFPSGGGSAGRSPFDRAVASVALPASTSTGGAVVIGGMASASSGTLVAGEYKTVAEVSGAGLFSAAGVSQATSTDEIGVRVTLDGTVVYSATVTGGGASTAYALFNVMRTGSDSGTSYFVPGQVVLPFLSGMKVEVVNVTDTSAVTAYYAYTVAK